MVLFITLGLISRPSEKMLSLAVDFPKPDSDTVGFPIL
jgi:hypothetical protein